MSEGNPAGVFARQALCNDGCTPLDLRFVQFEQAEGVHTRQPLPSTKLYGRRIFPFPGT